MLNRIVVSRLLVLASALVFIAPISCKKKSKSKSGGTQTEAKKPKTAAKAKKKTCDKESREGNSAVFNSCDKQYAFKSTPHTVNVGEQVNMDWNCPGQTSPQNVQQSAQQSTQQYGQQAGQFNWSYQDPNGSARQGSARTLSFNTPGSYKITGACGGAAARSGAVTVVVRDGGTNPNNPTQNYSYQSGGGYQPGAGYQQGGAGSGNGYRSGYQGGSGYQNGGSQTGSGQSGNY